MMNYAFIGCFTSILIVHSVWLRHVRSRVDLLVNENRSMAYHHGLWDSASHPTVGTMDWGLVVGRPIPKEA